MHLKHKGSAAFSSWPFLLLGVYCLLPFVLLATYAYPQADDYYFSIRDSQNDFWSTQLDIYLHWSGRFFGTAILRLNPLTHHAFGTYKFYALGIILAFAFSLGFLVYKLLQTRFSLLHCLGIASLLLALYLSQLPSTSEGLFWLTGFLTYTLPNVLFLWLLYFLYKIASARLAMHKTTLAAVAALTGALIVGANEMALLYLMATLFLLLVASWYTGSENKGYYLAVFLFCLLVSFMVVMAPGNFSRMAEHPQARQPVWSVVYAGLLSLATFYRFGGLLLLGSLVYVFSFGDRIREIFGQKGFLTVPLYLLVAYLIGTVFLMNFLFVWATGERPTPRLQNVIYFFLLLAWFYTLQVLMTRKPVWFTVQRWPLFAKAAVSFLFLLAILDLNNNISTAYLDLLSGKAATYTSELSRRNEQMAASDCNRCQVEPLSTIPATLHFLDLQTPDAGEATWINRDYARFWSKESVNLRAPNPTIQDNYSTLVELGKKWRDSLLH